MTEEEAKELKVASVKCNKSLLFHTRFFYKNMYGRKFVVNSHHEIITDALDLVLRGIIVKIIINIAPRYSKTEIAVKNFISAGLALNASSKYIHLSYSDDLALDNSEGIKSIISSEQYRLMYPKVVIKKGSDSKKKWYTDTGGGVYATSTAGQVTGFGAGQVEQEDDLEDEMFAEYDPANFGGALVIDDAIKPEDAYSETKREKINHRFETTIRNRVNSRKTPMVVMGQRTHPNDISGYLMATDGFTTNLDEAIADKTKWYVISLPALIDMGQPTERALWPFKHTVAELKKMREADSQVFDTQYQQDPQPLEGLMYSEFRTYHQIPIVEGEKVLIKSYADTADKGKDFLFQCVYHETPSAMYVLDILYTNLAMKDTEPMSAMQLAKYKPNIARFESNNGGEGFARAVELQTRALKNTDTSFTTFHQSENKEVRIFNNSARVTNLIYMPHDWKTRWPLVYKHVSNYLKSGKNANDDIEDGLTGMVEFFGDDNRFFLF